jgi:hypothetical protein
MAISAGVAIFARFRMLLEIPEAVANPALFAAQVSAQVSRLMEGRKVDVVLAAPNLRHLSIHESRSRRGSCCDDRFQLMTASSSGTRLAFLTRVVRIECRHLLTTDSASLTSRSAPSVQRSSIPISPNGSRHSWLDSVVCRTLSATSAYRRYTALGETLGARLTISIAPRPAWLESCDT